MAEQGPVPYYLSILSSVLGSRPRFQELLTWLASEVEGDGWERIVASYALTDVPEQILEVYRVPSAQSLVSTLERLEGNSHHSALVGLCRSRQMELTRGLPYDPALGPRSAPTADDRPYFLQEFFTLKTDQRPRFIEAMREVRKVFESKTWRLLSASQSLTPPYRVMHLWRFGIADQLDILARELPGVPQYADLEACCESQWQRLTFTLTSLPERGRVSEEARRQ